MSDEKRVKLYERLPEIYRIKDAEIAEKYLYGDQPAESFQLRDYLAPVEEMFSAIHENIESLYHDIFIETCDEWVIPYIADLLGTSHLSGDAWTVRADTADTIALRRRKGTLGAIELLTYILTKWGVHCVELRENLVWNQHLNHQRPDEGGQSPFGLSKVLRTTAIRGGTVTMRDPSVLSLLNTPFDPFAHIADVQPQEIGQIRYNLPNLAIFLWRLKAFRLDVVKPLMDKKTQTDGAPFVVRINVNPIPTNDLSNPYTKPANTPAGQPLQLFNTNRFDLFNSKREGNDKLNLSAIAPRISRVDEVPAPIPVQRLTENTASGAPQEYFSLDSYKDDPLDLKTIDLTDVGFQIHIPDSVFPGEIWLHKEPPRFWKIRGENLCAWETGLHPPLEDREIAIDPERGRVVMGVASDARAEALLDKLLLTITYGAVGEVGAHPISYPSLPANLANTPNYQLIEFAQNPNALRDALINVSQNIEPTVIEIADSRTHVLNLADAALGGDVVNENGVLSLHLNAPLVIRAADNQRPIIELAQPLAFRPVNVASPTGDEDEQKDFDAVMENVSVRLEGLFVARGQTFAANAPLISRAALNRLEILNCTLDPGGFEKFDGTRAPLLTSLELFEPYGFTDADDEREFKQTPEIIIQRSICGSLLIDSGYRLCLTDSIVDAGQGINDSNDAFAITNATDPANDYAAHTVVKSVTILGRTRVESIEGNGAIFVHALEVENRQIGCLKYSYFSGETEDSLPQHYACVDANEAVLIFTSEFCGNPAYCQISLQSDRRILEEGANGDQMGAFGFLLESHKWRNLKIRFREFMPVDVRPILIPVT